MPQLSIRPLLLLDAATCAAMGVLLLAASGLIADLTSIPAALLFYAGLALLPIALFMAAVGSRQDIPAWAVTLVVLGNAGWVAASIALPVIGAIQPNLLGWVFLLGQAGAVAVLAILELRASSHRAAYA